MNIQTSGIVLAQNSSHTLGADLQNLSRVTEEIIVVDGGSNDATGDIVRGCPTARLFEREFDGNFAAQRNFAMDQALGDWVLHMDTDELLDERSIAWIPYLQRIPSLQRVSIPRRWLVEEDGKLCQLQGEAFSGDRPERLFTNQTAHRYPTQGPWVGETLATPKGTSMVLRRGNLWHFHAMLNDRRKREKLVERYAQWAPTQTALRQRYLWEDGDCIAQPLEEGPTTCLRAEFVDQTNR